MIIMFLFCIAPLFFSGYTFIYYFLDGEIKAKKEAYRKFEIYTVVIVPILFLLTTDFGRLNDCCSSTAVFSPDHRISIYILIVSSMIALAISSFRNNIFPPLCELFINVFILIGIVINILICIHIESDDAGFVVWGLGNVPIILVMLIRLCENQKILSQHILSNNYQSDNFIGKLCLSILSLDPILKYPILTILIIPILISFSLFLILFEQKPDSLIREFTDTYKHGFSQLDHLCDNVECGGHYLCSVGANGHRSIVKPIRYGERNGNKIICNRQLLVSNAFEEIIQTKFPRLHSSIRNQYNKIGDTIHENYEVYNIKIVSDLVYILMKPLELLFLITIYMVEKKPEDLIARQYLSIQDAEQISKCQ